MRKPMILMTVVLTLLTLTIAAGSARANDANAYDVSLQNYNSAGSKTVDVQFSLAQKNVFPDGLADGNSAAYNDRLWVFVKYWNNSWAANHEWKHATLVTGGSIGTFSGGVGIADGKGAFCRTGVNQTLRWAVGTDETGIDGSQTFKVRVFAIEVVLIPTGAFWVGSGGTESSSFTAGSWTSGATIPFEITSESDLAIGQVAGQLWATGSIGSAGTLPAAYPKGYNGFFIMKYDISQGQYRDFLNTLTYTQQATRTTNAPNSAAGTGALINPTTYRNAIEIKTAGTSGTTPAVYGCNLDGNGTYDEADDGQWIGCNYVGLPDLEAYADWASLRPMTELEYEKACRGGSPTNNAVPNEYAWGNTTLDYFSDLSNAGTATESIGPTRPNANANFGYCTPDGPVRCGMFATSSTTRTQAGASYYGVMELSGNLMKRTVSAVDTGRNFTGLHGDGSLDATGNANVTNWPGAWTTATGCRGTNWNSDPGNYIAVSCRFTATSGSGYDGRGNGIGGRCVRTSP